MADEQTPEERAHKVVHGTLATRHLTPAERNTLVERIASALSAAEERGAARERERCLADIDSERLYGDTGDRGDEAYNMALEHACEAIRRRARSEKGEGE
jgi:hypothetical protein